MNRFGTSITLPVSQPGSSFTVQRYGFDTGSRMHKLDSANALNKLPKPGSADTQYNRMFVTNIQFNDGVAGITTATVSYEGLIFRSKKDHFEVSTEVETFSDVPDIDGVAIVSNVRWHRSLPRVTHVYVTEKFPNQLDVGVPKEPPRYAGNVAAFYALQWRPGFYTIFKGWILRSRSVHEAGPLFEVTDTYSYTINEAKQE